MLPFFIEDTNKNIFFAFNKIKENYLCFPKIIKNIKGKKYSEWYLKELESLKKNYYYLKGLDAYVYLVNEKNINKIYDPLEFVSNSKYSKLKYGFDDLTSNLIKSISDFFNIEINNIGIEGSILLGNYTEKSDIDILVYGKENAKKIQEKFRKFNLVNNIKFFNDLEINEYIKIRKKCGFGNDIKSLKEQFNRRYYGFVKNKQFSIVCVPYENEEGYINLNRKIEYQNVFNDYITITEDDNSCIVPSIYKGIDNKNNQYTIEIYNHYGINQAKVGEKVFIKGKKYELEKNNNKILIIGFWNNLEERFDLCEKKVFYKDSKKIN